MSETQKEEKITMSDLGAIQYALRVELLPVKGTGLNYSIIKNLVRVDKAVKEKGLEIKELTDKYTFKDAEGSPIKYAYEDKKDAVNYGKALTDSNGNFIKVTAEDTINRPSTTLVDRVNPEYQKALEEIENDVQIEFHKFSQDTVKKCFNDGLFDGLDLTALVGHLFELED